MANLTQREWRRIDNLLLEKDTLKALQLYRELSGCGLPDAKEAIGEHIRVFFPTLEYGVIADDD